MQPSDRERFQAVMTGMAKVYEREIDAPLLDAYWLSLRDWCLADFEQAAGHLMANEKFMPRPADFNELRKAGRPTAGEAWIKAVKSCTTARIPGGHVGGSSGDPLIDRVVNAIGGYGAIAMCNLDKLPFMERRFCEHYEEIGGANEIREQVSQITRSEATNILGAINVKITNRWSKAGKPAAGTDLDREPGTELPGRHGAGAV